MEVHFTPETEVRLQELAAKTGRPTEELLEDALAGYLAELSQVRQMLDTRYDEIRSGQVSPLDGEQALAQLRQKSLERKRHS